MQVRACRELPPGPPWAIGSASLNAWAELDDIAAAIADGALWVWGPTQGHGEVGWDLPLPNAWSAIADLVRETRTPLILGTGHLGSEGRRAMAELAASHRHLRCSVTHSLYVPTSEVAVLHGLGCLFEVDLYTGTRTIKGRPTVDLGAGIRALHDLDTTVYLTTDAGQRDVGDPYLFSAATLATLALSLSADVLEQVAVTNPNRVAAPAMGALTA